MNEGSTAYLVICSYAIAVLDLASALLFAIVSAIIYFQHENWTSLLALFFTAFWIGFIILLLVGIWRRRLLLVRCWLVFTCLGILLDGILLLYGFTLAMSINWEGVKITVIPFMGLAVEMTFVYIIYQLYLELIWQNEVPNPEHRATAGGDSSHSELSLKARCKYGGRQARKQLKNLLKERKRLEKAEKMESRRKWYKNVT